MKCNYCSSYVNEDSDRCTNCGAVIIKDDIKFNSSNIKNDVNTAQTTNTNNQTDAQASTQANSLQSKFKKVQDMLIASIICLFFAPIVSIIISIMAIKTFTTEEAKMPEVIKALKWHKVIITVGIVVEIGYFLISFLGSLASAFMGI